VAAGLERLKALGFAPATVIDVGVANGTHELYEAFPDSHHVLVEPLPEHAPELGRIVGRLRRAEHVPAAAGATSGVAVLNVASDLQMTSTYAVADRRYSTREKRTVPSVTLDEIWTTRGLVAPALVKVDAEGSELDVLRGGDAVLGHCEYLIVEVAVREVFIGAPEIHQVIQYLAERGFVVEDILSLARRGARGELSMMDVAFVPRDGWVRRATATR
jgi:FkbM family methyltransferase